MRRAVHPDIAVTHLSEFLVVALNDETTYTQIAEMLNISEASVSRGVKQLSQFRRSLAEDVQGYGLVYTTPDLLERRRNVIKLTNKGEKLRQEIIKILAEEA